MKSYIDPSVIFLMRGIPFSLISFFLFSCSRKKEERTVAAAPHYELVAVEKKSLSNMVHLPGEIRPYEQVDIFAKVNSFVKDVRVDRGTVVKKGDIIAILDAPELEAQLSEALAKLHAAESAGLEKQTIAKTTQSTYKRLLQTSKTPGTVSLNDLELAQSKMLADSMSAASSREIVASAKAYYLSIQETKNYLTVTAPFNGIITERNVHPGALVGPASKSGDLPMFRLEEEARLRLVVAVPEAYTGGLMDGRKVKFTVKAYPDDSFAAIVNRDAGSLMPGIRSEMIEMDILNKDKKLKPGMYAEVKLELGRREATLAVPETAVVQSTERMFVIRNNNGSAEWVNVTKGNQVNGTVEVFGDLHEGDKVLKEASDEIRKGTTLK